MIGTRRILMSEINKMLSGSGIKLSEGIYSQYYSRRDLEHIMDWLKEHLVKKE